MLLQLLYALLLAQAPSPPGNLRSWVDGSEPVAIEQWNGSAWVAIPGTGVVANFNITSANSGTVSTTITVPTGAELVLVGISGYSTPANFFSGGGMTFTKGGVDTAMTTWKTGANSGDNSTGAFMAAGFYLVLPDVGANRILKWDWLGTGIAANAPTISILFLKGINTSGAVRGSGGGQNASLPYTSSTITAQLGDLVVAWVGGWTAGEGTINSWSNLTEVTEVPGSAVTDGAWAAGSPSGNTAVAASTASNFEDGGIIAICLIPAAAGAPPVANVRPYTQAVNRAAVY